ncbi:MAG: hypothetical protein WKF84_12170 [Pyrinomonadaceae bacterium]
MTRLASEISASSPGWAASSPSTKAYRHRALHARVHEPIASLLGGRDGQRGHPGAGSGLDQRGSYREGIALAVAGGAALDIQESTVRYLSSIGLNAFGGKGSRAVLGSSVVVAHEGQTRQLHGLSVLVGRAARARTQRGGRRTRHRHLRSRRGCAALARAIPGDAHGCSRLAGDPRCERDRGPRRQECAREARGFRARGQRTDRPRRHQRGRPSGAEGLVIDGTTTSPDGALGQGIYVADDAHTSRMRASTIRRKRVDPGLVVMRAARRGRELSVRGERRRRR